MRLYRSIVLVDFLSIFARSVRILILSFRDSEVILAVIFGIVLLKFRRVSIVFLLV